MKPRAQGIESAALTDLPRAATVTAVRQGAALTVRPEEPPS